MSGIDLPDGRRIRKGAPDAIIKFVEDQRRQRAPELNRVGGRRRIQRRNSLGRFR